MYTLMMTANGHVDPRSSMAPPIIMRTAATPMPTPKSSLGPESYLEDDVMAREGVLQFGEVGAPEAGTAHHESRRGSSTSMDALTCDQRSLVSFQSQSHVPYCGAESTSFLFLQSHSSPARRSPLLPRGSSSWGSRRSSWNSLGRAPSLKRRDTSGERESLLSGERAEDEDGVDDNADAGGYDNRIQPDPLELLQASTLCPAMAAQYGDCNGGSMTYASNVNADPKDDSLPEDDIDDDVSFRKPSMS